jgi:pimeloyl-ACP methyl ester carboxylesterase
MKRFFTGTAAVLLLAIIGGLILGWTPDTDAAAMRAKYAGPTSQFIDVEGMKIHVRDVGPKTGPVIVLLHGSNASLHTWEPWIKFLSASYRVIAFDQAGHGLTGPHPKADYSTAAFVRAVDGVTQKLSVTKFTLGGNSMGGGIAVAYAIAHPDRLNGLVLVDASGAPDTKPKSLPIGFRIAQTPGLRSLALYITPRALLENSLRDSISVQSIATPAMIDRYWELLRYPGNRQATIDRFATKRVPIDPAAIRAITVPTLVIWGEEDKLIPFSAGQWFAANIKGATLLSYKQIGHAPMEEAATETANDLMAWLATQPFINPEVPR